MNEEAVALLRRIAENTGKTAAGVDKLAAAIPKAASIGRRIVEVIITIITVAGLVSIIDVIKNWMGG